MLIVDLFICLINWVFYIFYFSVNETDLNKLCDDQNNNISERLDKINGYRNVANVLLDKTKNYLNYVKTNPLEQFIPNTKLFNGRPFMDYKGQFLLYSRMTK